MYFLQLQMKCFTACLQCPMGYFWQHFMKSSYERRQMYGQSFQHDQNVMQGWPHPFSPHFILILESLNRVKNGDSSRLTSCRKVCDQGQKQLKGFRRKKANSANVWSLFRESQVPVICSYRVQTTHLPNHILQP